MGGTGVVGSTVQCECVRNAVRVSTVRCRLRASSVVSFDKTPPTYCASVGLADSVFVCMNHNTPHTASCLHNRSCWYSASGSCCLEEVVRSSATHVCV